MNPWNLQKLDLLEARGYKCELCGSETSNDCQVHHCLFHRVKKPARLKRLLDQPYNLMVVCQRCHLLCNGNEVRHAFWWKQVLRYGLVKMVKWYLEVPYRDKPVFWAKGPKWGYSYKGFFDIGKNLGEVALIGAFAPGVSDAGASDADASGEKIMNRPLEARQVIESLHKISETVPIPEVPPGLKGAIIGILEDTLGSRVARLELLFRLFPGKWETIGEVSTKDLTPGQWNALNRWIKPERVETGDKATWFGNLDFVVEASRVMEICLGREGQEHLDPSSKNFLEFCLGKYGAIPFMACGHEATGLTGLYNPYCIKCAEGGSNKKAYQILANQSIMELEENA